MTARRDDARRGGTTGRGDAATGLPDGHPNYRQCVCFRCDGYGLTACLNDRDRNDGTRPDDDATTGDNTMQRIETGCYIDGHWGVYAVERLHDIATNLVDGYDGTDKALDDAAIIELSLNGNVGDTRRLTTGEVVRYVDAGEFASELYDELTDQLPTNNGEPFYWHWRDGELYFGIDYDDDSFTSDDDGVTVTDDDGKAWAL